MSSQEQELLAAADRRRRAEEGVAAEAVRFSADETAPEAGPGGTPKITISIKTEISGEWVTNEMIAYAARQLALSMASRLGAAADESRKEGM
jgi:hypothetical protein